MTSTVAFDEDYQTSYGSSAVEHFQPSQDPLDPNEIPFPGGTNTLIGRRISLERNGTH